MHDRIFASDVTPVEESDPLTVAGSRPPANVLSPTRCIQRRLVCETILELLIRTSLVMAPYISRAFEGVITQLSRFSDRQVKQKRLVAEERAYLLDGGGSFVLRAGRTT